LTSGDEDTPDSDISEKGLPDADLNYLINDDVLNSIVERRVKRKETKIKARMEKEAINQVL
jgi:hypothetical protein